MEPYCENIIYSHLSWLSYNLRLKELVVMYFIHFVSLLISPLKHLLLRGIVLKVTPCIVQLHEYQLRYVLIVRVHVLRKKQKKR